MTTSPRSRYFSAQARTYGSVRSQLMQVYVQKSTSTTLPRSAEAVRGGEFSHSFALSREASSDDALFFSDGSPCRKGTRRLANVICCIAFISVVATATAP